MRSEYPVERWLRPADWVAREIRRRIAKGTYPPDHRLPSERRLAEELGIGRRSVRTALALLEREGLVSRGHGRCTRVLAAAERPGQKTIGVVYIPFRPMDYPEAPVILDGIQDRLTQLGYRHDLVQCVRRADHRQPPSNRIVFHDDVPKLDSRYSGVVFVEAEIPGIMELEDKRFPIVVANLEMDLPVTATWIDHERVGHRATEILVSFGHRRIGFMGRAPELYFYGEAQKGYRRALAEGAVEVDETLIAICDETNSLSAYLASKPLLDRPDPPTAVVVGRDIMAQGLCQVAAEKGLEVGRDLSVIGYDDISWQRKDPFLTTFREPCYDMGAAAVEMLADRLVHGWRPFEKCELETRLILRRSAAPVPIGGAPAASTAGTAR